MPAMTACARHAQKSRDDPVIPAYFIWICRHCLETVLFYLFKIGIYHVIFAATLAA